MLKRLAFWSVIAVFLALPVALAEMALRMIGLGDPVVYYRNASYRYAPEPNQAMTRRNAARITIDSHGLRATTDWGAPADRRILFIGDSVTWGGTAVDDNDTFAARTCLNLTQAGVAPRLTCGNAGVNAYGTDNMTERLRFDPVLAQADLVVVTLIGGDTTRGLTDAQANHFFVGPVHGPLRALWEASAFVLNRSAWAMRSTDGNYRHDADRAVAIRSLDKLFAQLREVRDSGKKVLLVYSPYEFEITGAPAFFDLSDLVRDKMAASGLPFLDLTAEVKSHYAPGFYTDSVHLSPRGHAVYGEAIARRLSGNL